MIFIIKRTFLTDSGYFNWISITGIIAILTLIMNHFFNSIWKAMIFITKRAFLTDSGY